MSSRTHVHPASAASLNVLVRAIRPVHRRLLATMEARLQGTGISVPLRGLLERLYETGPQTVPALGRALTIPRQFALKLEGEAAGLGLVVRTANAAHRRSPLIRLTPAGRAAIEGVLEAEQALLSAVAARFDADDVEAATGVLAGLAEALAEGGGAKP